MEGMLRVLLTALLLPAAASAAPGTAEAERIYLGYQKRFATHAPLRTRGLPAHRLRLALDAIEDLQLAGAALSLDRILTPAQARSLPAREQARWLRLRHPHGAPAAAEEALAASLEHARASPGLLYELLRLESRLRSEPALAALKKMEGALPQEAGLYRRFQARAEPSPSADELRALFLETPSSANFQQGAFQHHPRLFLFCRRDRRQKCLLLMKDKQGQPVRDSGGALWSQPALALSSRGLPPTVRNGHTPTGVHLIRGVMPEANFPTLYGRHRRLILEFAPGSPGEAEQKKLLPPSSHEALWWKQAVVARDAGRTELRIHGTGERNGDPATPYHPFVPTVGCVAQRELSYGGTSYNDQRLLLDALMRASGVSPVFTNEPGLRGLLYVVELSDGGGPVTLAALAGLGIL